MMMLLPITLIFFFWRQFNGKGPTIVLSLGLYILYLTATPSPFYGMHSVVSMDCALSGMGVLMILMSNLIMLISFYSIVCTDSVFSRCHWLMYLSLVFIFMVKKSLVFYVLLELSLAPISLIILGWGYQPERSISFMYMVIYTLTACLPFLVVITMWWGSDFLGDFLSIWAYSSSGGCATNMSLTTYLLFFATTLGFLVKFPVYSLHLWLPKAHVEAPISGSMILAGALLKLGGFGWYLVMSALVSGELASGLSAYAGLGGVLVSVLCLRQIDMKVIIAYSSVGHLSLAIMAFSGKTSSCYLGGLMIMLVHGFSSPGMFYSANVMYSRSSSRNILLNSSFLSFNPILSLWWFLICMANMSAPPSSNLLAEVISINSVVSSNFTSGCQISFLIFLSGAYTLLLYSTSQQGQKKTVFWQTLPLTNLELTIFFLVSTLIYGSVLTLVIV